MNTAVIVVCGVVWVAVIALQAAEIREQRQTIERLVQKYCDLPPQGAKARVVSPYIEKTEDET